MAFRGGCYADYLPAWLDTLGAERMHVIDFEQLVEDPATTLREPTATWLGLDPAAFPADALSSENRTTGFKSKAFQRVALAGNDRLESVLRRHPDAKRKLRAFYYRLNGQQAEEQIPAAVRAELAARYGEPNARLAAQLDRRRDRAPAVALGPAPFGRRAEARAPLRSSTPAPGATRAGCGHVRLVEPGGHDVHERALEHDGHHRRDRDAGVVERVPEERDHARARAGSGG